MKDTLWTLTDYRDLPRDGKTYQVIGGALYMTPSPTSDHQKISRNLQTFLWQFVEEHGLGEVLSAPLDVVLSQTDVVQPDVFFIRQDRLSSIREDGVYGPPDLVVEILSPSTRKIDETLKRDLYEKFGVAEYLIFYPREKIVRHYATEQGRYTEVGTYPSNDNLPLGSLDLTIPLHRIFPKSQ